MAYSPFGDPLTATPDTLSSTYEYGWLGQHQRGTEKARNVYTVEMPGSTCRGCVQPLVRGVPEALLVLGALRSRAGEIEVLRERRGTDGGPRTWAVWSTAGSTELSVTAL